MNFYVQINWVQYNEVVQTKSTVMSLTQRYQDGDLKM